jgi:hypothetical protein
MDALLSRMRNVSFIQWFSNNEKSLLTGDNFPEGVLGPDDLVIRCLACLVPLLDNLQAVGSHIDGLRTLILRFFASNAEQLGVGGGVVRFDDGCTTSNHGHDNGADYYQTNYAFHRFHSPYDFRNIKLKNNLLSTSFPAESSGPVPGLNS